MNTFLQHLRDPEYMHVLLNPLPVYGLTFGTLALALALFLRNHRVTVAALVLVFVGAISAWPVYQYGESAYDRVKSMSDPAGEQWLDEHMARGEKLIWMFYVLAAVSATGIAVIVKCPRTFMPVSLVALALSSGTLGVGGYISYAGGHVRHREFRFEAPPAPRMAEHHHEGEQHEAETHEHEADQKPATSAQPQPEHAGHEQMQQPQQPGGEKPKTEEEQKQLEASRLQLEASRLQLEASRKQLEAAGGASPAASASGSPGASPTGKPSPEQHKHDEHQHDEPKP
jgi:hypothetical protein